MRYIFNFENEQEYENYNFNDVLEHINDRVLTYLRTENTIKKENIYTYIDYLESSGTQYINTGYVPTQRTNVAFADITFLGYVGSGTYIPWFNVYTNETTLSWRIEKNNTNAGNVLMTFNSKPQSGNSSIGVAANNRYKFLFTNDFKTTITTNNSAQATQAQGNQNGTENARTLTIFNTNSKLRFWTFVWGKGNDSPLNLVPVRKGNVGYMMDILTRKLYGNVGTGSFILGPDSDKTYDAEVEYIEGTGTQWIDTRYVPQGSKDIRIEGKFTPKGYTADYGIWWGASNKGSTTSIIYQMLSSFSDNLNTGLRIIFGKKLGTDNINIFTIDEITNVTTEEGQVPYEFKISYDKILMSINNGAFVEYITPDAEPTDIENTSRLSLFRGFWALSYAKGLFHYFKVYKKEQLVLDLIPVRIGTVGYMYDRVSKVLLSNMGTGNFGVGPDV